MSASRFEDLYSQSTEADKRAIIDAAKALQDVGENARACLGSGLFQDYRKQFEVAQSKILDAMIFYTNNFDGSTDQYAMKMVRYIQKIQDLRLLLNQIPKDATKGMLTEESQNGQSQQ